MGWALFTQQVEHIVIHIPMQRGCDSVHTLNLTINSSSTGTSSATACDSYTWDGVTYTTSGTYSNTYTNAKQVVIVYIHLT